MKILSPAKINLFLEAGPVDEKRGLHRIVSLVDIIALYDIIEIEESDRTEVIFIPDWKIPVENTVTKVLSIVKEKFRIDKNVRIVIRKNIPPGSGLGGGSSNAAAVLNSLIDIFKIDIEEQSLNEIGLMVGSDVPLFIKRKRCIIRNFGDEVVCEGISTEPLAYSLFIPPYSVSTGEIYRYLDRFGSVGDLTSAVEKVKILNEFIRKKDMEGIEKVMFNRLEEVYLTLYKEGREVKDRIERETGKRVFVSGSGGTLFCVFPSRAEAERKMAFLNINGWKGYIVESIITS